MSEPRTLEQRLKFDHGLPVGRSLIRFTIGDRARLALVEICANGRVFYLVEPDAGDMYSSWKRLRGEKSYSGEGSVIVWGAHDPQIMAMFDGEPVATVPVRLLG